MSPETSQKLIHSFVINSFSMISWEAGNPSNRCFRRGSRRTSFYFLAILRCKNLVCKGMSKPQDLPKTLLLKHFQPSLCSVIFLPGQTLHKLNVFSTGGFCRNDNAQADCQWIANM